ncbi:MAG: hypothetical protein ACM3PE_09070 [Deltaproteobacteria bacterium]
MTDEMLIKPGKYARARFYAAPCVLLCIIVIAILLQTGVIPKQNLYLALALPSLLELSLIILLIINIFSIFHNYRLLKKHGHPTVEAWQKALEAISSPRLARLVTLEPQLYYALYLSYRKRKIKDSAFSSRQDSYVFLIKVLILLCLLEVIAVTVMLPQSWLTFKLVHMFLGLWAVLFIWSDYRAMTLYGHRVGLEGVRLRLGLRCSQQLGWDDIAAVRKITTPAPAGMMGPGVIKSQPGVFYMGLGENCNLEISLREPRNVRTMIQEAPAISRVLLSLEDPEAFLEALRGFDPELC